MIDVEEKTVIRDEQDVRKLKNRLHRMMGQLSGIEKMIDENRYCGDILIQVGALESALQSFGYTLLDKHLHSCVVHEINNGNEKVLDEVMDLMKKLK
ncbi:metal-sensing transcriptional repressor [Dubosiella newyorkensis]|uniref:metal-sensing transcriptional repressor n=1 Tax=Dubosiella newyorkensis TaxID=1862672 RepID=UPI00269B4961|nr:metal-sensing transcriptional repressor [Dubosiella newyorkensis]